MAQTGYTPISIYYSATATNTPTAGNLVAGELAINTNDGVLYYKDSSGVVQSIASKAGNSGSFTNLAYTGTLTGGTGVVNLGSGQFYKDASGNVGLGVTPSTWSGGFKSIELGTVGNAIWGTVGSDMYVMSGVYYNSGFKYAVSSKPVSMYEQASGQHLWSYAGSGTAGNAITFSEAMRIDSNGRVGIGTTSPYTILTIQANSSGSFATAPVLSIYDTNSSSSARNWAIGSNIGAGSAGQLNFVVSSAQGGAPTATTAMSLDSSGNLLVGTTSDLGSGKVCIVAASTAYNQLVLQDTSTTYATNIGYVNFVNSTGGQAGYIAHTTATTVAYLTTSDARLKENIVDAPSALNAIKNVKVRSYNWKEGKEKVTYGFVAQELYTEIPEVVGKGDDKAILENNGDVWQLEYGRLTPILFKAIQEQQALIENLTTRLNALEGK